MPRSKRFFFGLTSLFLALGAALAAWLSPPAPAAESAPAFNGKTQTPITYIRDYGAGHLNNREFIAAIAANTPDLLVLGKDAPIHHNWGPVAGTGGENQAFGQGEAIRRLSPEELRRKIESIRAMVARIHAAGVRWVMPYICTMTVGGSDKARTGFWEFYDHWDEYKDFGLGPRPAEDPVAWMQRKPDGSLQTYYDLKAPSYAPNYRWAACIHSPGWRQHLTNVVRLAAEVGYDGVYMDNNRSTRCYCERCQQAFRRWLAARFTPTELKNDLGLKSADEARLAEKPGTYLWKLTGEFWTDSKIDFLRELKAVGERARDAPFHIFANPSSWLKGALEIGRLTSVASFIQSEEPGGPTGAHPGMVEEKIAGPLFFRLYNRRELEYKFTQSLGVDMRVTMTTRTKRAGSTEAKKAVEINPWAVELAIAESAAYGGGGAPNLHPDSDARHAIRRWREFYQQNSALYEGGEAWAPAAVVAFAEQQYESGDASHQASLQNVAQTLANQTALFDFIHEGQLNEGRLSRFRAVVVPAGVDSLSEAQLETFRAYAKGGGRLIVLGEGFAARDEKCRPRPAAKTRIEGAVLLPDRASGEGLLKSLSDALGRPCPTLSDEMGAAPAGVGVNAYAKPSCEQPEEIFLHLVNYNVALGADRNDPPIPRLGLIATVPLPRGWRVSAVKGFSPCEGEDVKGQFKQQADALLLRVRKLTLYQVIRISGAKGEAR